MESGALYSEDYDGNSVLLDNRNSECNGYLFNSGYEMFRFTTKDKIIDFISDIGKNKVVYAIAAGEKYLFFYLIITNLFKMEKMTKELSQQA